MKTSNNRAFVNQVVVATLFAIGVSGSVGIGSVWMRHQISVTAEGNKAIENRLAEVERLTQQTDTWIAEEQDITALVKRNSEWRLGLMPPQDGQVLRITEDPVALFNAKRNRGLFQDRGPLRSEVGPTVTFSDLGQGIKQPKDGIPSISFRVAVQP